MNTAKTTGTLYTPIRDYIATLSKEFHTIPDERKKILRQLSTYLQLKFSAGEPVSLIFICTHNSRRSHIAQIWAQTASYVYGIHNVRCLSGGTEATAFNQRAVKALKEVGFNIQMEQEGNNPVYNVSFSEHATPVKAFSKTYDDPFNSAESFVAIMTCSQADENCPFVPGTDKRIALTYDDPKDFDETPLEENKYRERVREIGREILFAFSTIQ